MQRSAGATEKFEYGKSNWVGTSWRAGGEDAVGTMVSGRSSNQIESLGAIEYPQNKQMRKAFDMGEARFELGKDFENTFRVMLGA